MASRLGLGEDHGLAEAGKNIYVKMLQITVKSSLKQVLRSECSLDFPGQVRFLVGQVNFQAKGYRMLP